MAGRPVLLLLLLLLAGTPRSARACPGTPGPAPVSPGPAAPSERGVRSGWGPQARLSPRSWDPPAAPFWTMATPQRFGRRR
ncbi:pro-FMRFamide-related neuropeptide FF-like [Vidua macroura]|uniref:pro-FMRFamide-related neuropeptide FF-like n=1 Tax=Vidua macroura TaxID=187451 RepID=UPI0023A8CA74|nr:pro-FMRFamide-related neuropeptide FF-like [Vidua macroura]